MHDDEIVKVEEIKRRETKDRREASLIKPVTNDQSIFCIDCAQTHVDGDYQTAEKQHCFNQQQENRPCVGPRRFHKTYSLSQRETAFSRNAFLLDVNHLGAFISNVISHVKTRSLGCSLGCDTLLPRLLVVSRFIRFLLLDAIEHHTKHAFTRQLLQQAIHNGVTSNRRAHDQQGRISPIDQQIRVGKSTEWRRVDDDLVKHLSSFIEQPAEARSREQLRNVFACCATRQ